MPKIFLMNFPCQGISAVLKKDMIRIVMYRYEFIGPWQPDVTLDLRVDHFIRCSRSRIPTYDRTPSSTA